MMFRMAIVVVLILLVASSLWLIGMRKTVPPFEDVEIADGETAGAGQSAAILAPVGVASTEIPEARMPPSAAPEESWLTLPTLPASATEADVGAEIYRLVCRDCHGDVGQGLTDEWRAKWNPDDQNCWQSKCHASNHPIEGFDLPRYVPALMGSSALARFQEPTDLQEYIKTYMPWHNPGSLTNQEYWQLTAFLIRENGGDPIEIP